MNPSRIGSRTHDYKRHGTVALYAAFNTLTGKVIGKVADKTNGKAFLSFLKLLNRRVSADKDLHIILDNLSAHKTPAVREWLEAHNDAFTFASHRPVRLGSMPLKVGSLSWSAELFTAVSSPACLS